MRLFTIEHAEAINDSPWFDYEVLRPGGLCRVPVDPRRTPVASARPNDSISARQIRPDVNWMIELSNASDRNWAVALVSDRQKNKISSSSMGERFLTYVTKIVYRQQCNWRCNKIVMAAQKSHNLWILIESLKAVDFLHAKNKVLLRVCQRTNLHARLCTNFSKVYLVCAPECTI